MQRTSSRQVRRMVLCALFTALTAACSQIALATPWGVPVNLGLFAVYLAGAMLGPVWGTASQFVFLALAAVGVPVMAGFQGGPNAVFGKTGGYALGYLLAAAIVGWMGEHWSRGLWPLCAAMVLGCAACYALGTVWFMVLTGLDLIQSLTLCVLPFLPGDAVKIALAAMLVGQLDKRIPRL